MEDSNIIALFWERSEEAIAQTASKYGRYCKYIADSILRNEEDAEECVNDTYLRLWNSIPPERPILFKAYIAKVVRNLALNRYEASHAQKRGGGAVDAVVDELDFCLSDPSQDGEEMENREALADLLDRFLGDLKPEVRKVFVRRYFYAASVEEIAESYGMSVSKVKMTLLRTREKLKKYLEKEGISL